MRRLLLVAAAAVLLAGGCATLAPATCDPPDFDPPGRLTCDVAVAAAREQLANVSGISRLEVVWSAACPDNARCRPPDGNAATVMATLGEGDILTVYVSIGEDGVVQAEAPQRLVPSQAPPPGG
jgi:hypothetical protein